MKVSFFIYGQGDYDVLKIGKHEIDIPVSINHRVEKVMRDNEAQRHWHNYGYGPQEWCRERASSSLVADLIKEMLAVTEEGPKSAGGKILANRAEYVLMHALKELGYCDTEGNMIVQSTSIPLWVEEAWKVLRVKYPEKAE